MTSPVPRSIPPPASVICISPARDLPRLWAAGALGAGLGVCELCYHGATEEQIAACEMPVDPEGLEAELLQEFEQSSGRHGRTLVAFALAGNPYPGGRQDGSAGWPHGSGPLVQSSRLRRKVDPCPLIPLLL
jgi:hypothetical protein